MAISNYFNRSHRAFLYKMWKFWMQKDFIWDEVTIVGDVQVPYWVPFSIKWYITLAIVMKIWDFHQWFITFSEHLGYRIWSMSTAGKMCDFWSELKKITCQRCINKNVVGEENDWFYFNWQFAILIFLTASCRLENVFGDELKDKFW